MSSPSEHLYRQILDGLKEVVFHIDSQGRWIFLNPAWTELTGFPPEESLGRAALESVHLEDRQRFQGVLQPLTERKAEHSRQEVRWIKRDGSPLWVELFARPLVGDDGAVQGLVGTLTDVSGRRRESEALS